MNAFIYSVKSLFNRRTTFGGILLFFIRLGKEKGHRQVSFFFNVYLFCRSV